MALFWSASRSGFFDDALGPKPSDAIAVTADLHAALGAGQANGLQIATSSSTGLPMLTQRSVPVPTVQEALTALAVQLRTVETAGIYFAPAGSVSSYLFPTDDSFIVRYNATWGSIQAGLRTNGLPMIARDGTPVPMTNSDASAMITKALGYIEACSIHYQTLFAQAQASPSTSITLGWPVNT